MSDVRRMINNMRAHAATNSDTFQKFQESLIKVHNREEEAKNADKRTESQFNKEKD